MGVQQRSVPPKPGAPKRRIRNYLLDRRFQLKYTGMVIGVTVAVATVLGAFAYNFSKGQTESVMVTLAMQPDLNPETAAELHEIAEAKDRQVLAGIAFGVLILTVAVGATGILVTHRLVGPAYKLKMLLAHVADGHLKIEGGLRKGDELQDVFQAFERMVQTLRENQAEEVQRLDEAIAKAQSSGIPAEVLDVFVDVRDRMQAELD